MDSELGMGLYLENMTTSASLSSTLIGTLSERGFIEQCTDLDSLAKVLEKPVTFYIGFDPSADCLHVGHLVPIMLMKWMQDAGHRPIVLLGGGTAMIGDPSGKDKTRQMLSAEEIQHNLQCQKKLFGRFIDLDKAQVVDNGQWLLKLNYVSFLRDIGKHFSVNRMLAASGAQQRLERGQGYSLIEFNYHLCQSYDYLVLQKQYDCVLQCGGDDQWFNILGGVDLVRRESGTVVHGLTVPLVLTSEGKKMGKTEKGAVWLDADRVTPYDYYQYWVNVSDPDVIKMMKLYTTIGLEKINTYAKLEGADIREAKYALAFHATALTHGNEEALKAQNSAKAAFSGGSTTDMPTEEVKFPIPVVEFLVASKLCKSKGEARRLIKGGGVRLDAEKVTQMDAMLEQECIVWAGKKRCVQARHKG
jgi:tyrosyl-tRNA synthetase